MLIFAKGQAPFTLHRPLGEERILIPQAEIIIDGNDAGDPWNFFIAPMLWPLPYIMSTRPGYTMVWPTVSKDGDLTWRATKRFNFGPHLQEYVTSLGVSYIIAFARNAFPDWLIECHR